ncbi:MAG: hypothetical protein ACRETL_17570, partial [Gammaproteobacteria bacterium]
MNITPTQPRILTPAEAAAASAETVGNGGMRGGGRGRANNAAGYDEEGNPNYELQDEGAERVRDKFAEFLQVYREPISNEGTDPHSEEANDDDDAPEIQYYYPYVYQAYGMARHLLPDQDNDDQELPYSNHHNTTLFVDYQHVLAYNVDLAEALQTDMERFEPHLRRALRGFLLTNYPALQPFITDQTSARGQAAQAAASSSASQVFFAVAFYNYPVISAVRDLRMECIGRLTSFCGTITRTSDVRPELISAIFRCANCGLLSPPILQEYHYTRPTKCRNPQCATNNWILETHGSEFVDWQKLRVQENTNEIPPGSMPRSVDVIVRNDMVELPKAGDRYVFTGTLVVVPDQHALSRTGEAAIAQRQNSNK